MSHVPFVRILAADPREVGARALGAPQHRMIVFGLHCERIGSVALHLVAQRADHLRMARIASLADVDVASGEFERGVEAHVRRIFHRLMNGEERSDLDDAADAGDADDREHKADRLAFQPIMKAEHDGHSAGWRTGALTGARSSARLSRTALGAPRTVIQML